MGLFSRSRSPVLSLILGLLGLPSTLSAQPAPVGPAAAPPPGEILQRVREAYARLSSLNEEGLLEVVTSEGGTERVQRRRFELDLAAGGDFYFILRKQAPSEVRETLWRSDGEVVHHDSLTESHRSMPSLAAGLAAMLDEPERSALLVPSLLAGDPAAWPEAGATLQGEEPCGGRTCWVLAFPPRGGILEWRYWIDRETFLVRKSVLRAGPEKAARTYRVDHAVQSVDGAAIETAVALDGQNAGLETFGDVFNVRLASMIVRVIGPDKRPIPDLRPEDFKVFVGRQEVPVHATDWIPPGSPSGPEPGSAETDTAQPEQDSQAVIFVDAAIGHKTYVWVQDHLSLRPRLRELLASLPPRTRIAVVALRSRLEIWQDFTQDREAVYQAITRALYLNGKPGPLTERSSDPASLTAHFDFEAAGRAIRHVPALTETVEALVPFSGVKSIFYVGASFDWHPWLYWKKKEASSLTDALQQARASVFVLDTRGNSYSSGVNDLLTLGRVGGGGIFYAGELSDLGLVAGVASGYYVLTFDVDTLPRSGSFDVKLRNRKGEVLAPSIKIGPASQKKETK